MILEMDIDVTERKRMEMELESLSRLPKENPEPVIHLDQSHIISYSNPAAQMLLPDWVCGTSPRSSYNNHRFGR